MAAQSHKEVEQPSPAFISAIAGPNPDVHPGEAAFAFARKELDAVLMREQDDAAQIVELNLIRKTADDIEAEFTEKGLDLPNIFILYSAGVDVPDDIVEKYMYGTGPIEQLPKADIAGHLGIAGAIQLDTQHTAMVFNGRAHPFSGVGQRYAEMIYARPLNVIKELMRRQRERGIQSAVITTYLTGVDELSPLGKGDLGIVVDHTEFGGGRSALSAGAGPRNFLDKFIGERFQPKVGRASHVDLAKVLTDQAKSMGIRVGAAAAIGTPGTTSYQSVFDRAISLAGFDRLKERFDSLAEKIFGEGAIASLFFDMSLSFEVDVLKQTVVRTNTETQVQYAEEDFPTLFVVVPTDTVGAESDVVDHNEVVKEARRQGKRNGELIRNVATALSSQVQMLQPIGKLPDWVDPRFSLKSLLPA